MKILLTGMTPKQCGPQKVWVHYSFFDQLFKGLLALGHEVAWEPVFGDTDLSSFDFAVVGLHCPASMSAKRYKFGPYLAAHALPHLPILQDWRVRDVCSQLRGNERTVWNLFARNDREQEIFDLAAAKHEEIEKVRRRWRDGKTKVVAPLFRWADPEDLKKWHPFEKVLPWDPDGLFNPTGFRHDAYKYRRWVCASLTNQDDWTDEVMGDWPIEIIYRSKESRKEGGVTEKGMQFLPLSEIGLISSWYAESWGILMPDYGKDTPMGWWRSRPKISALGGNVITGTYLGHDPLWGAGVEDIEAMKADELRRFADKQRAAYFEQASTMEQSLEQLSAALEDFNPPVGG